MFTISKRCVLLPFTKVSTKISAIISAGWAISVLSKTNCRIPMGQQVLIYAGIFAIFLL
jgi:hypothetical protein